MARTQQFGQRLAGLAIVLQLIPVYGGLLLAETHVASAEAIMLVPVTSAARQALPARVLDGRNLFLGGGLLPGSLIVRTTNASALPSWHDGVIAIHVSERLCGAA